MVYTLSRRLACGCVSEIGDTDLKKIHLGEQMASDGLVFILQLDLASDNEQQRKE